jgi:hypothetical protein
MILNIIMMILLYILTLYWIIVINFVYMFSSDLSQYYTNSVFDVFVYWIFILWLYLIYILFNWIYKKRIHKNYLYAYLAFFVIFFLFYFWYYIRYDKETIVPENIFETKLQNIEVKEDDNWLVQLWKMLHNNKDKFSTLSNFDKQTSKRYRCIIWDLLKDCEENDLYESMKQYELNKNDIEFLNNEISKIIELKYFKIEFWDFLPYLQGLTSLSRISLFSTIYELENWNEDKAIKVLLAYKNLWDRLLGWDNTLVWMIVWVSIENVFNNNIKYILENYNLDKNNLVLLKNELNEIYDSKDIISNVIKIEYQDNKYWFNTWLKDWVIKSSMLFNVDEFFNEMRKEKLVMLNWEENYYEKNNTNYFKREYLYKFLWWISNFSINEYKLVIENLNIERGNIVWKVEEEFLRSE